ncbi:hypothetical protein D915_001714 [Fasciola hepatica]|uniref:Uncharacterized protein n=1 Tax=Fasciola hepatica TaxID=6192 RepID=A0A4E0REZ9_FASHE|nr:hypothetical protein D915_001714 [Fasciola hepatica]
MVQRVLLSSDGLIRSSRSLRIRSSKTLFDFQLRIQTRGCELGHVIRGRNLDYSLNSGCLQRLYVADT